MAALLPECMEQDGADPCTAFVILQEKVESQKTEIDRLQTKLAESVRKLVAIGNHPDVPWLIRQYAFGKLDALQN